MSKRSVTWKKITTAIHEKGSKIFLQLMHTGRISHFANMAQGAEIVAPSAIAAKGQMWTDSEAMQDFPTPKEMSKADINHAISEFVQASKNAISAGFDGVELHGANGYLLEQFLNPGTNKRKDEYGGSIENRCRFAIEVSQAVANGIGKEKTGIRLSPYGVFNDMLPFEEIEEEYSTLVEKLNFIGLVYVHLVDHSSLGAPNVNPSIVKKIRNQFSNTLILSGGFDKARAEKELNANAGNLIAFGRPFIANPDLVTSLKNGTALAVPDMDTFYTLGEKGYIDYK